ncbi:hypothetical protein K458DRAFT_428738 [Lentithecium fluviatile CBS 122367]|uniref:F-box domain-containing protein n=1 Tax=Lentithecium fluviatile CBS 122367 TaxID=1168545 RepID=A0A6G1JCS9_9PLEO|nr:hypothetical protein K458DRAFT_428738 [Lentithecium fluviatile CBS 122367]
MIAEEAKLGPHGEQQSDARAMRRALMRISPENSGLQTQSPLFALLPSEIRNQIFEFAACQTVNCSSPVPNTSHMHRPGHEYNAHINTALLRTCRLVYYETRTLPLRSATHHLYEEPSESFNPLDWDHYLFHLSSQSGKSLHHLHVTKWRSPFIFDTYLKDHLHWRRLTWTLCASEWTPNAMGQHFHVAGSLARAVFPDTCQEVNLEYESLDKYPKQREILRRSAQECKEMQLTRRDGSKLNFAESAEYAWRGTTWVPHRGDNHWEGDYVEAKYHIIRIRWRGKVSRRGYMHYDHWDCLQSDSLVPLVADEKGEDEKEEPINTDFLA